MDLDFSGRINQDFLNTVMHNLVLYKTESFLMWFSAHLSLAQQPNADQGLLILEVSCHTKLHITASQPVITWQRTSHTRNRYPCTQRDFVRASSSFFLSYLFIIYFYILCPHVTYSSKTHKKNIHAPAGFKPATPASDRPQTLALESSTTGICW